MPLPSWLKAKFSSLPIGNIGEQLLERLCRKLNVPVQPSAGDSDADLIIGGHRIEVKFSTLWAGGFYKFQQIRDQNYDYIIALDISPYAAHCWVIPTEVAIVNATTQHGGHRGSDTRWLTINPPSAPDWLSKYGGPLETAIGLLKEL